MSPTNRRPDRRLVALALTLAGILLGGLLIARSDTLLESMRNLRLRGHVEMQRRSEVEARFRQGVLMLHSHQYDNAATAFHRVLELAPRMPEAHVNMGFALVGLHQWKPAHDFFVAALELNPEQANGYYGLAITLEAGGDLPGALGAMRTYLHRSKADDPFRRKAEAAVWEWEEQLHPPAEPAPSPEAPEQSPR